MAVRQIEVVIDDIDGRQGAETITFALAGSEFEIDLVPENSEKLHKALAPFIAAAHKPRKQKMVKKTIHRPQATTDANAIREWARKHGYKVPSRGRLPDRIVNDFNAHHTPGYLPEFSDRLAS